VKKPSLAALALLVLAPVLFPAETLSLAIGYIPHIQFAPLYVGIEKGFYGKENIDLKIEYGMGVDIFSLLAAGRIDLGLSDSDQLLIAGAKKLGLLAVFQYYQSYPVTIVARADAVKSPGDFAGLSIGTPELFGTSYIGLQLFLEKFGLEGKTGIERIGYTQIPSLLGGRIAGVVCFYNNEPLQLRESGVPIVQWDVKDFSDMVGASFLTSRRILEKKEGLLRGFVRATARAMDYTVKNRDEAVMLSEKYIGRLTPEKRAYTRKVLEATTNLFESGGGYGFLDGERYGASIRTLARMGLIGAPYPAAEIIRNLTPGH